MNAPYAFAESASGTQDSPTEDHNSPFISEEVLKRRSRRLFMERFEQAFFVGLLLTLISFTVFIVLSEYSTPSALAASGPESVPAPPLEPSVKVAWENEPTFDVPDVPRMEDSEVYPVIGEAADTTWINAAEEELESSPYVEAESSTETGDEVLDPVPAPQDVPSTEVAIPSEGVSLQAYLGQRDVELMKGLTPDPEEVSPKEPAQVEPKVPFTPVRTGVLRVGGGHARDLVRLYTEPAVVYGLER